MQDLLNQGRVLTHPFVIGELSLGNIPKRESFLEHLRNLRQVREATHAEVAELIEVKQLWSKGLSYFDLHLLCAAIKDAIPLWTLD
ncbi:MAG: hypothetical protein ACRC6G_05915, partial [Deefgea sp.]